MKERCCLDSCSYSWNIMGEPNRAAACQLTEARLVWACFFGVQKDRLETWPATGKEGIVSWLKSFTLFPILSLLEPLLQTLPVLHSPGSAHLYSSPPGNPLSGNRTQLVVAFEHLSRIFSSPVSGVSDAAYSAQSANWGSFSTAQRGDLLIKRLLEWFFLLIFSPSLLPIAYQDEMVSLQVILVWYLLPDPA